MPVIKWQVAATSLIFSSQLWASSSLETSGDIVHLALPATALAATVFYEDGDQGMWQFAKAAVSARLVTEGLKFAIDKERPDGSGNDSFPSGHTTDSFMAATFIQQRYGWQYGLPAYVGATFVAYSRVESDKHYLGDVLAGAAIGALAGWYFTDPYQDINVIPIVGNGQYGLYISGRF
ncbi:phosphatase PAP2 family protein [Shewanella sp. NIFS-20-20]|uniref:phosphatase PAP2 family protein n=1 Tax=Shewanella sp. NIFS-20-20 TaxID=2853806 RepID=UPI001C479A76|nr:phosphatase PAP2 family protein [Shewanella sp. NIFS-20-20]MBV7315982.1 phosphatase PAP2 family protein [Shewanella sp. NIFS-20-20]